MQFLCDSGMRFAILSAETKKLFASLEKPQGQLAFLHLGDIESMEILTRLWRDEAGFIITIELMLIATVLVIGILVGLVVIRDAITSELSDVGGSISDMNQSYAIYGITGPSAAVSGSGFADNTDSNDTPGDPPGMMDNCIMVTPTYTNESGAAPSPNGY